MAEQPKPKPSVPAPRKYNRRANQLLAPPPYYEAFDRIATALEKLHDELRMLREDHHPHHDD